MLVPSWMLAHLVLESVMSCLVASAVASELSALQSSRLAWLLSSALVPVQGKVLLSALVLVVKVVLTWLQARVLQPPAW